jgi:hypothetical protein
MKFLLYPPSGVPYDAARAVEIEMYFFRLIVIHERT